MDFRLFHLMNGAMRGHPWLDRGVSDLASWSVPLFAVATVALWFLARPGGPRSFKLASVSALCASGLGLLVNQAIGRLWDRPRPYATHPAATVLLATRSRDPSFPSDHATAAFAIGFAILAFSVRAGAAFLVAASLIAVSRVLVGLHYPGDVAAGALVGLASAALVTTLGRGAVERVVSVAERITDPAVGSTRRFAAARLSRRR